MITDMIQNKKLNAIVTELFIRGRKLNISLIFITQSYLTKDVWLNTIHFFITKVLSKRELQQIAMYHSSDISPEDFVNIYRKCTAEPYSFFVIDTTLASDKIIFQALEQIFLGTYNKNRKILIEKRLKYQLYHLVKFISMSISLVKIYYHPINNK